MFDFKKYTADKAEEWDAFVAVAKNATFLFYRQYMDYHSDRFKDASLMIYHSGRLCALFPANDHLDGTLWSHRGLTYGGLIMDEKCRTAMVRDMFAALNVYLSAQGFHRVVYKHIPAIYSTLPAEEDLFALVNVCHAGILSRDVGTVVMLDRRLPLSTLRKRGVKKAQRMHLEIREVEQYTGFWQLLEDNLLRRYKAKPVHTLDEIQMLHDRFPNNIRLFVVLEGSDIVGGSVLYIDRQTVKTQYISANERGKSIGAMDFLFDRLLQKFSAEKMRYFDFGTSNKVENDDLNDSLTFQKEGFGGRAVCYDTYEWML